MSLHRTAPSVSAATKYVALSAQPQFVFLQSGDNKSLTVNLLNSEANCFNINSLKYETLISTHFPQSFLKFNDLITP